MQTFFITGTDTEVGKTVIGELLLKDLQSSFQNCQGFKPVSAGCEMTSDGLRNSDALTLQKASTNKIPYELVNPFAYAPAIAPHIAADEVNDEITLDKLQDSLEAIRATQPDLLLIEGAGGWRLPLNQGQFLSQFVQQNQIPVVLVIGMRLGCLNHALLTYESIVADGLQVVGWIANQCIDEMPYYEENLETLKDIIGAPLLAEVAYQKEPELKKQSAYARLITWGCVSTLSD